MLSFHFCSISCVWHDAAFKIRRSISCRYVLAKRTLSDCHKAYGLPGPDLISTHDYTFNTLHSNTAASLPPPSSPNLKDSSNIIITRASSSASILSKSPRCNSSQLTASPSVSTASSFISNKRKRLTTTANGSSPSHNDDVDADVERAEKRQRNSAAARKYRQKFVDRIAELEKALAEVSAERDQLKLKLVRSDAEVEVLRGFVERS